VLTALIPDLSLTVTLGRGFTGVNKRADEDREAVNVEVHYRIEMVAYRDKLDLDKPVDRVAAQSKVSAEDPDLYRRYTAANTVRVGKSR
jgi:hypothetical protein